MLYRKIFLKSHNYWSIYNKSWYTCNYIFTRSSLKLAPCPREHIPYMPNFLAFQQKAYSQHFTSPSVSWLNCPRELYPLYSNFKSDSGSLKRQVPRNPRSRTFEGGLRSGYSPRTSARIPQRRELTATWTLNIDTRRYNVFLSARRHIPLTIYWNLTCYNFDTSIFSVIRWMLCSLC